MTITTQISTTTETTKTSTGSAVVNDIAVLALFCILGLLASFYIMTHFPFSVEDATYLAAWL
jgi:hypothetical protein